MIDKKAIHLKNVEEEVLKVIHENLALKEEAVDPDKRFSDLSLDSMSFLKICASLEIKFDFAFEENMVSRDAYKNIRDFISYIESVAM